MALISIFVIHFFHCFLFLFLPAHYWWIKMVLQQVQKFLKKSFYRIFQSFERLCNKKTITDDTSWDMQMWNNFAFNFSLSTGLSKGVQLSFFQKHWIPKALISFSSDISDQKISQKNIVSFMLSLVSKTFVSKRKLLVSHYYYVFYHSWFHRYLHWGKLFTNLILKKSCWILLNCLNFLFPGCLQLIRKYIHFIPISCMLAIKIFICSSPMMFSFGCHT